MLIGRGKIMGVTTAGLLLGLVSAAPLRRGTSKVSIDIQGHRGGRGEMIENTLPSFAWGLIDGATTLEMDNVWHDESIEGTKCKDTAPVTPHDPLFPYVGKYIANLTLAQIKTLDCGSLRQHDFPIQLIQAGTKISTLAEVFSFVKCADPHGTIRFNIESKINPAYPNRTRVVEDFVQLQLAEFKNSGVDMTRITFESFDWRTLIRMKQLNSEVHISALVDDTTIHDNQKDYPGSSSAALGFKANISTWLGGIDLSSMSGDTVGAQVAQAAASIGGDILSPVVQYISTNVTHPWEEGFEYFTNSSMVDTAHSLGLTVIPWTINQLDLVEYVAQLGVDGILTDYPDIVHRWSVQRGIDVMPRRDVNLVMNCLKVATT